MFCIVFVVWFSVIVGVGVGCGFWGSIGVVARSFWSDVRGFFFFGYVFGCLFCVLRFVFVFICGFFLLFFVLFCFEFEFMYGSRVFYGEFDDRASSARERVWIIV